MTDPDGGADAEKLLTRARESYAEVLDATKHQDDKINRVFVGIAFLTTGAIALLFRHEIAAARYLVGESQVPLVAIATGAYLACTLVAVVLLLLSLSSELRLPGRSRTRLANDLEGSLLYFTFIAVRTEQGWRQAWRRSPDKLDEMLLEQYLRETRNLAQRARVKYGRTDEAAAMFVLALMFLAVAFLLALEVITVPATGLVVVGFGWIAAGSVGGVFAVHTFLQLYSLYRNDQQDATGLWRMLRRTDPKATELRTRMRGTRVLLVAVPGYVLAVVYLAVVREQPWRWLLAGLAIVLVLFMVAAFAPRWLDWKKDDYWAFPLRLFSPLARWYTVGCAVLIAIAVALGAGFVPWLAIPAGAVVPLVFAALTVGRQVSAARRVVADIKTASDEDVDAELGPAAHAPAAD